MNTTRDLLSLGQKMLLTGAAPEVLVHALDEGMLPAAAMNASCEGVPLVASWVKNQREPFRSLAGAARRAGVEVSLDWPVATSPTLEGAWVGSAQQPLWLEHALIRLVRSGLNPLQDWKPAKQGPASLLQWASMTNRPWLLKECLDVLPPAHRLQQVESLQITSEEGYDGEEWISLPVIHASLRAGRLEVAQVWQSYGAKMGVLDSKGESAIFNVNTPEALRWVLAGGGRLDEKRTDGAVPVQVWTRQADVDPMSALRDEAKIYLETQGADIHQHTLGLLGTALDEWDVPALKDLWKHVAPDVVLANGMTPLGYLSRKMLSIWSNRTRDNHKLGRASKMLAFLWHRTDLEKAASRVHEGASDLQIAALFARMLGGQVSRSMDLAKVKQPFCLDDAAQTLALGDVFFKPAPNPSGAVRALVEVNNDVLWRRQKVAALASDLLVEEIKQARSARNDPSEGIAVHAFDNLIAFIGRGRPEGVGMLCVTQAVHLQRLALAAARRRVLSEDACSLWYGSCLRSIAVYGAGMDTSSLTNTVDYSDLLSEVKQACAYDHGNVDSDGHVHALCVLAAGWGERATALSSSEDLAALMDPALSSIPSVRGLMPLVIQARLDTSLQEVSAPSARGPRM